MRILMVTNTYAPARNGVAVWASLSVRELRGRGHEVDVLTFAHPRRVPADPLTCEVPTVGGIDEDFPVGMVSRLPVELSGRTWDIVHVHHPILLGPAGVELGRRSGARIVFTCHSVYSDYLRSYYWGVGRSLVKGLDRRWGRFADRCDVVFAPSSHVESWLRDCGTGTRIERLDAPADTDRVRRIERSQAREALGLRDEPVVLYVGRVAAEKRVQPLIEEFDRVAAAVPDVVFVVAGSGRKEAAVRRDIWRRGLGRCVRMLGSVDQTELSLWYSAADLCVSASRSEAGPLTVVEAMSCGCPSVSLRAPGFADRIVHGVNGLFGDDRPGGLAEAMIRVLKDRGLRSTLAEGCLESAVRYTPRAVTDRMVGVYESLLA